MNEPKYIVTKSDILNSVRFAIERLLSNELIITELTEMIGEEIQDTLEQDCEEYQEDDLK
jgi:hypothetical protein